MCCCACDIWGPESVPFLESLPGLVAAPLYVYTLPKINILLLPSNPSITFRRFAWNSEGNELPKLSLVYLVIYSMTIAAPHAMNITVPVHCSSVMGKKTTLMLFVLQRHATSDLQSQRRRPWYSRVWWFDLIQAITTIHNHRK